MTAKRFTEIISIQKVIDNQTGKEYDCLIDDGLLELLNELHEENQTLKKVINNTNNKFGEERWEIMKLIIEYDTTNKYSEKDVIDKIKDIMGLVMV